MAGRRMSRAAGLFIMLILLVSVVATAILMMMR